MAKNEKTVRYYDHDTRTVAQIPARETSDRTIRGRVEGVKGRVHFDHNLPAKLVRRIEKVAAALAEVMPDPLEKWLYDFSLDAHPQNEVRTFELMVSVYERSIRPADTPGRRQEVFSVVLGCSMCLWPAFPASMGKKHIWGGPEVRDAEAGRGHADLRRVDRGGRAGCGVTTPHGAARRIWLSGPSGLTPSVFVLVRAVERDAADTLVLGHSGPEE